MHYALLYEGLRPGNKGRHDAAQWEAGTPFPVSEANEVGKGAGG